MIKVIMPQVGQDIASARIVEWLKKEGDAVRKGEPIVVVESEKAAFEVEAEGAGVLLKILRAEDEEVEILKPIAYIGEPGESIDDGSPIEAPGEDTAKASADSSTDSVEETVRVESAEPAREQHVESPSRILASPAAKRLAKETGVDLGELTPSGPGGRIIKRDVEAASTAGIITQPAATAGEDRIIPFSKVRKGIARRLTQSWQTIPHFYLFADVDIAEACRRREQLKQSTNVKITFTDLVIHATAAALREFDRMNVHVQEFRVVVKSRVNIGVAVSVEDGLLVPVIADTDRKSLEEIAAISRKNAEAARRGIVDPTVEGTFTISSLGMHAIPMFLPVINPPEAAILAVGAVEKRVVPTEGGMGVRERMTLVLACDHRAIDGACGAQFLNRVKALLESPEGVSAV